MSCSTRAFPAHHQFLEPAETHWVDDVIQPSHPLSSPSSPAFSLSQHQDLFQWASSLHQVAEVLESFQWIFRTDSFRINWFDILAVQGTLKSLIQQHSSKASALWRSVFFMELSHPYITTGNVYICLIFIFLYSITHIPEGNGKLQGQWELNK